MSIKTRLSAMMFLFYFILGAFVPIISLYFRNYLGFSGYQTGLILSMSAGAAFISPLLGAFVADRIISSDKLLASIMFLSGTLLLILSFQRSFGIVFILYTLFILIFGPSTALTNSISFSHLEDGTADFGAIRKWGTFGWIIAGWLFSIFWLRGSEGTIQVQRLSDALRFGGLSALGLGIFLLTFPKPPVHQGENASLNSSQSFKDLVPVESLKTFLNPSLIILCLCALCISVVDRYYYFGLSIFLKQRGVPQDLIMPAMSIGQLPEIFGMIILGAFLKRFGVKAAFLLGIIANLIRFSLLALGSAFPVAVAIAGIAHHGFAFTFFYITLFIYIDNCSTRTARTGVHQLFAIVTSGFGAFLGNQAAGFVADLFTDRGSGTINFLNFWIVPAAMTVLALVMVFLLFDPSVRTVKNE